MRNLKSRLARRKKETERITIIGLFANIVLFAIKLSAGILGNSRALIADALHSLSDLGTDIITLFGVRYGSKPADETHHYGHQKIECLAQFMLGLILIATAGGIGYAAGKAIYLHEIKHPGFIAIAAALVSIVSKEVLYQYTIKVGRKWKSKAIIANAWHHRSDSFSSIAVLLGVGAAYLVPALGILDAYASILVSFLILKIGVDIARSGFLDLIDTVPSQTKVKKIQNIIETFPGVIDYHELRMRPMGGEVFVSVHVCVKANLTVEKGHNIARKLKEKIILLDSSIMDVLIHIEPHTRCSTHFCDL